MIQASVIEFMCPMRQSVGMFLRYKEEKLQMLLDHFPPHGQLRVVAGGVSPSSSQARRRVTDISLYIYMKGEAKARSLCLPLLKHEPERKSVTRDVSFTDTFTRTHACVCPGAQDMHTHTRRYTDTCILSARDRLCSQTPSRGDQTDNVPKGAVVRASQLTPRPRQRSDYPSFQVAPMPCDASGRPLPWKFNPFGAKSSLALEKFLSLPRHGPWRRDVMGSGGGASGGAAGGHGGASAGAAGDGLVRVSGST